VVSFDLPALPSSATRARQLARREVAEFGPDVVDTVALLATELVTNAVLHARTDLRLGIEVTPLRIRLSVADGSSRVPVLRNYDSADVTGRGLNLVEMLAAQWGCDPTEEGKSVWCEVIVSDGDGPRPP
jgi:two-component sensor histidine kinase